MENLIWLIPVLPLAGFALLVLSGRRMGDPTAGWFATLVVAGSFVITAILFVYLITLSPEERALTETLFTWMPAGSFRVNIGFLFDPLSSAMCMFITGIGALIHLYSIGYMKGDENYAKFFTYLNLFVASMLLLVLGDNLLLTFLGWEGVGACSYLLISFWFTDPANASAGKKAFVTNRIGDFGYMLGVFLVFVTLGSINYGDISASAGGIASGTATAIALLFFLGACGKSAQLPIYVWLPDAMAGPTPVSALIHAATMVTSGVFLLTRLNPIMAQAGWANDVVAWVGVLTALFAATVAIAQTDIKKVLAYSTVSQLGYMFLAVGTQNYVGAIFHMITHAFFKALLFLGSGSVIHAMDHEQDMRKYGQLRKYLPITSATFLIGWLSIAGVPPFSGFWSKDEILAGAFNYGPAGPALWAIGLVTALLTAFYMTRQVILTFFGDSERWRIVDEPALVAAGDVADADAVPHAEPESDDHAHHLSPDHTPHESPWTMTLPLVALAILSAFGGLLNLPFTERLQFLGRWLEPIIASEHELPAAPVLWTLAIIAVVVAAAGIAAGYAVYQAHRVEPDRIEQPVFAHAWYVDETYAKVAGGPGEAAFEGVAEFDQRVVDGAVNGVGGLAKRIGDGLRPMQSGLIRTYALGVAVGAVLLLTYVVTRMSI